MTRPRGRPPSKDPKITVTLRLKTSLAERMMQSPEWRAHLERLIEAEWSPPMRLVAAPKPIPAPKVEKPPVEPPRVDVPLYKPGEFRPQPKKR